MMTAHPFEIVYLGQKHVYEPSVSYWAGFLSLVLQTYTLHSLLEYISEQKKQEYCSLIHYEFAMHSELEFVSAVSAGGSVKFLPAV